MDKTIGIQISKILDKYLPADRVGSAREQLRMNLHNELTTLISLESQLQLIERMKGITVIDFGRFYDNHPKLHEYDETKPPASLFTVLEAYLKEGGK